VTAGPGRHFAASGQGEQSVRTSIPSQQRGLVWLSICAPDMVSMFDEGHFIAGVIQNARPSAASSAMWSISQLRYCSQCQDDRRGCHLKSFPAGSIRLSKAIISLSRSGRSDDPNKLFQGSRTGYQGEAISLNFRIFLCANCSMYSPTYQFQHCHQRFWWLECRCA
jgi:hypothetical protein